MMGARSRLVCAGTRSASLASDSPPLAATRHCSSALALVGAKDQGIRVRFQLDRANDLVLADKIQIQQVA